MEKKLQIILTILLSLLFIYFTPIFLSLSDKLIEKTRDTYASDINLIVMFILFVAAPFCLVLLFRISLSSITAILIALFPLMVRSGKILSIPAYTNWGGQIVGIEGLTLYAPFLFLYAYYRYGINRKNIGWDLPSLHWYKVLAISGIICQFFFASFLKAIPLAYLVVVPQFFWLLLIIASIEKPEDATKMIWGIISAVMIAFLLKGTSGDVGEIRIDTEFLLRSQSTNSLGSYNEYSGVVASTLCLIPILIFRVSRIWRITLYVIFIIFLREVVIGMTRGAYIGLLPLLGYMLLLNKKDRNQYISFIIAAIIAAFVFFKEEMIMYLSEREFFFDTRIFKIRNVYARFEGAWYTLTRLVTEFPNILVGFGFGTYNNWDTAGVGGTAGVNSVHQGLLAVWVTTGLAGLIGFMGCLYKLYRSTFLKLKSMEYFSRVLTGGVLLSLTSWLIYLNTTSGNYTGGWTEVYAIMTTEMGLIIALTQKIALVTHSSSS